MVGMVGCRAMGPERVAGGHVAVCRVAASAGGRTPIRMAWSERGSSDPTGEQGARDVGGVGERGPTNPTNPTRESSSSLIRTFLQLAWILHLGERPGCCRGAVSSG
jgi:hypothetical protein